MQMKQLYRYIFLQRNNLSEAEIKAIPTFFSEYKLNAKLPFLLKALGASELFHDLYPDLNFETVEGLVVPTKEDMINCFHKTDGSYHYFAEFDEILILPLYIQLFLFSYVMNEIFDGDIEKIDCAEYSYSILVISGEREVEKILDKLENHFECHPVSPLMQGLQPGQFNNCLRIAEKNKKINLSAWQALIARYGWRAIAPLFFIAPEIEEKTPWHQLPKTREEVIRLAHAIKFKSAALAPALAEFCVRHFIPEVYFEACIGETVSLKKYAYCRILPRLQAREVEEFLSLLSPVQPSLAELIIWIRWSSDEVKVVLAEHYKQHFDETQQKALALELLSKEEKKARKDINELKEKILRTEFSTGVFGSGYGGGEQLQVEGKTKIVPVTVARMWKMIQDTYDQKCPSYAKAWQEIAEVGRIAANAKSSLNAPLKTLTLWMARCTAATELYNQFMTSEARELQQQERSQRKMISGNAC